MKSFVAAAALAATVAAAPAPQSLEVAGPVALVNPAQVALDGFSEDVNQDGFVDPIAPAGLAYGAPVLGYGAPALGGAWWGKRSAEAEPQFWAGAYLGGPLNLAIPHGALGAVLHPNGAVAPPYTPDQQAALAEKAAILAERGQLIKREAEAEAEAEADPQLLLGGVAPLAAGPIAAAPLGGALPFAGPTYTLPAAPAVHTAAVHAGIIAAPDAPVVAAAPAVVEAAPAVVEAAPAAVVAAPALAAPAITYAAPAIAAPAIAAPAIAAPAIAAPAIAAPALAPAVVHTSVPVTYTHHVPVSRTHVETIPLGVQTRVVSGPVVHGLGLAGPVLGAPAVVAAEPVAAEVAVVEE